MRKPKAKRPATKAKKKPAKTDPAAVDAKQAKAYADMEPYLCKVVNMGTIASNLFDCTDRELYDFAVHQVDDMLDDLRARYYALDFPI
jgi:hypothetical protein